MQLNIQPPDLMHLNLAEKNSSRLLSSLQCALESKPKTLTIELIGPGTLYHDTALMLHEEIRKRPEETHIHARARTCLIDGAILLWLAADTRSMRNDTWIQLSQLPEHSSFGGNEDYPNSIRASEETPSATDFRTIVRYVDEFLPVQEIAGFRLFEPDLRELGILDGMDESNRLAKLFNPAPTEDASQPNDPTASRASVKK